MSRASYNTMPALPAPFNLAMERPPSGSNLSSSSSIVTVKHANAPPTEISSGQSPPQIANTKSPLKTRNLDDTFAEGTSPRRMHIHNLSTDDSGSDGATGPSRWSGSTDSSEPNAGIKRHNSFSARFGLNSSRIGRYGAAKRAASPPTMRYASYAGPNIQASDLAAPTTTAPLLTAGQFSTAGSQSPVSQRVGTGGPTGSGLRISTSSPDESERNRQISQPGSLTGNSQQYAQRPGHGGEVDTGRGVNVSLTDPRSREAPSPMRSKSLRDKDKKAMLSRALQRANAAVELDNAQDYLGAMEAYAEACDYLNRVMSRSSNEEDKRKLQAIRATYTARVEELGQLEAQWRHVDNGSAHQTDANSESSPIKSGVDEAFDESLEGSDTSPTVGTATLIEIGNLDQRLEPSDSKAVGAVGTTGNYATRVDLGSRSDYNQSQTAQPRLIPTSQPFGKSLPLSLAPLNPPSTDISTSRPQNGNYLEATNSNLQSSNSEPRRLSRSSSKHSISSTNGIRRKNLRLRSGDTEAEFDAALDAAVEAAYDDGYEPFEASESPMEHSQYSDVARSPQSLYAYNSFAEREAVKDYATSHRQVHPDAMDSDDEERMLEEITRDFMMDNQTFDEQAKSVLPRQSDSSGSSGQTWGSSDASSVVTSGTALSPVNEHLNAPASYLKQHSRILPPPTPPPTAALPQLPPSAANSHVSNGQPSVPASQVQSVQERRLAGQRTKKLQIKTAVVTAPLLEDRLESNTSDASHAKPSLISIIPNAEPTSGDFKATTTSPTVTGPYIPQSSSPYTSPIHADSSIKPAFNFSSPTSTLNSAVAQDNTLGPTSPSNPAEPLVRPSSTRPPPGRNFSSLSLRNRVRSSPSADTSDASPGTPVKFGFATIPPPGRKSPLNMLSGGGTAPAVQVQQGKKVHLFSNEIHTPHSSDSPSNQLQLPRALEPCPEATLLRPFWLMRCIYQTIAHPRGGYLTTKLFIPRDVWIVKNVKLKGVEEKVAACDLLTAALNKLGAINTLDADALLVEMGALETAMDHAQSSLIRKLGNDVGPQHVSSLFKDAPPLHSNAPPSERQETTLTTDVAANTSSTSFGTNTSKQPGKSSLVSSWRKLRSKSSGTSLASSFAAAGNHQPRESLTLSTLPMAGGVDGGPPQRTARSHIKKSSSSRNELRADGPNAHYMGALARLCEAVQVLDQIARQVEDPGLRNSSPTYTGLELGVRHAAEFFGFYVCRFVLQDVTMLADKYVKRATEWVLL